jgi:heparan sulfate N-deacetylase/N-sulfotransferase NDST2
LPTFSRSLWPGLYAQHLDRWLDTFPASQLILVDGDQLQNEPHFVLRELFSRLGLPPLNGLAHRLKYSPEKGFYCVVHQLENRNGTIQKEKDANVKTMFLSPPLRCLGSSKGRHYQPMSHRLRQHLEAHFRGPNLALKQLLRKYKFPVPKFLLSVS